MTPTEKRRCGRCGFECRPTARFCHKCGAELEATQPSESEPPASTGLLSMAPGGSWSDLVAALRLFFVLLGLVLISGAVITWGGLPMPPVDVVTTVIFAGVVIGFALTEPGDLWRLLKRSGFRGKGIVLALAAYASLLAFATVYFAIIGWLGFRTDDYIPPYVNYGWPLWSVFVLVSLAPAISEEVAFRGYIMQRLERSVGRSEALLIQAALFSVLHLAPVIFVSHFAMGLVFGLLRNKTGSLYPGMVVHALYNATVLGQELLGIG